MAGNVIQCCSDVSDVVPLFPQLGLYLKPIAKLNISVHLPQLKLPGKSISNREVMEKLKYWTIPDEFTSLKVSKTTLEFIRFEAEIESRSKLSAVLARLDGRFIKISGFTESLKVRACEAKCDFPTRHTWDSYFRDAKNMNEMKPGERPDTIHSSNLPCKWFASKTEPDKPSEYIVRKVFETFGEVRSVDVPAIDPYRSQMKAHISGIKMFSYQQDVVFEGYIQFKEYICFMKAMDALRGMKLVHKEDSKIFSASIKVDFDKTKHLSDSSIRRRRVERERLMSEEREREEQERLKKEKEEAEKEAERLKKFKEREEKLERRRKREEKRKMKQLQKLKAKEAEEMNRKIASEERLLVMAQRRLESIRLLSELLKRCEEAALNKLKEKKECRKHGKKSKKGKTKLIDNPSSSIKEEELRQKLMEKLKSGENDRNQKSKSTLSALGSSPNTGLKDVIKVAGAVPVSSASSDISTSDTDSLLSSILSTTEKYDPAGKSKHNYRNTEVDQEHGDSGRSDRMGMEDYSRGGKVSTTRGGSRGFPPWYGHTGMPPSQQYGSYNISGGGNMYGAVPHHGPHRGAGFYPRRGRGLRRGMRFPGRGRGGYVPAAMPPYFDPLLFDINHQYYKYFQKLTQAGGDRASRSKSRSVSRSSSRSRKGRYRSRSRSRRSRSYTRSRSRSRSSSRGHYRSSRYRRYSRSRTRSRSRSRTYSSSRSRSFSRHRSTESKMRSPSHSASRRYNGGRRNKKSYTRSRSKSRSVSAKKEEKMGIHHSDGPQNDEYKVKKDGKVHVDDDLKSKGDCSKLDGKQRSPHKRRKSRWDGSNCEATGAQKDKENSGILEKYVSSENDISRSDKKNEDNTKKVAASGSNTKMSKIKKSPIRFPSTTHSWSCSLSRSRSLSWEKKGEQQIKNKIESDINKKGKDGHNMHKYTKKKSKKKDKKNKEKGKK